MFYITVCVCARAHVRACDEIDYEWAFFSVFLLCILIILMIMFKEVNLFKDRGFCRQCVWLKETNKHVFDVYSYS
jgi:hypothetical protein